MQVQLVRLWVLYTDIELEFDGASAESVPDLDRAGKESRRFYFIRRTTATLMEIRSVIHQLENNPEFAIRKGWMSRDDLGLWDAAVKFFNDKHDFLKAMRNDLGGHFQTSVAEHVLDKIEPSDVGLVEVYKRGAGVDLKIKFSYDFVASALIKNREAGQTADEFAQEAFTFLLEATKHVVNATQAVATVTLFH